MHNASPAISLETPWIDTRLYALLLRGRVWPVALVLFAATALYCAASRLLHGSRLDWGHCALPWAAAVSLPWVAAWVLARRGWRPARRGALWAWAATLAALAWAGRLGLECLLLGFDAGTALRDSFAALSTWPVATLAYALILHWRGPPAPAPLPAAAAPTLIELPQSPGERLAWAEVEAVLAAGNYVELCVRGRRHLLRSTMADTEALLAPMPGSAFVRIHRTVLVNLAAVQGLTRAPGAALTVLMRDGSQHPVSRRRQAELEAAWQRHRSASAAPANPHHDSRFCMNTLSGSSR